MLNSKKITIGGKVITVSEVKVKRVLQLLPFMSVGLKEGEGQVQQGFAENIDALLQEGCGLSQDDLGEFHGSELKELWKAFREVNDFFFETIRLLGLEEAIKDLLSTTLSAYGGMFASLLSGVTLDASTMDLAGLSEPGQIQRGSAGAE